MAGHDYAAACAYFVTIVTHNRDCILGDVVNDVLVMSAFGQIAHEEWARSAEIRREVELDAFVVMPDHVHGIVIFHDHDRDRDDGDEAAASSKALIENKPQRIQRAAHSLGTFVGGYKGTVTRRINVARDTPGAPMWQRNYHETVIHNERQLNGYRKYIGDNPMQWVLDHPNM